MDSLFDLLNKIHDLLIKNGNVAEIFNVEDDKNNDNSFFGHDIFYSIDWIRLFSCFVETVNYLIDYAYKNDDIDDYEIIFNETIYDLYELLIKDSRASVDVQLFDDNQKLLLFKTHVLLLMFAVTATITKDISKLINSDLFLLRKAPEGTYYRGHSDEKYKLVPTICRSYDAVRFGREMTYSVLYELYKEPNLLVKYNNIFGLRLIDDEFCAFMQHSCSYSPFLDLTKNHIVALSFATSNHGNINEYFQKKSAVFEFKFNENVLINKSNISDLGIYFTKTRLRFFSVFKGTYLFYCIPSTFDPIVCLLTNKTNDRMKYQDGAFLFFQSCVIVNGHILMPYRIGKIIKYTISPNKKHILNKTDIYQKIISDYRKYDYEHLMDPYLYFSEITKK